MKDQGPIIPFLLEENILDKSSIDALLDECSLSGKNLISALKANALLDEEQLVKIVALDNDIEFINLTPEMIDQMVVKNVPYDIARQHNLIPVRIDKSRLYVAMDSPLNLPVRDMLATKTGYKVVPLAASGDAIKQAISIHYNVENVTRQDIVEMRLKDSDESNKNIRKIQSAQKSDAPIVRLVDSIITGGIEARCSDIHIEPSDPDMRVRYRVDGILIEALNIPAAAQKEVISHIKILAAMDISERRLPQDGHIVIEHNEKMYDLRVSSLPATSGEKIVIRVLDTTTELLGLERIVSNPSDLDKFNSLIANPYGLILLTGPTGSGKTTTLYSMIHALNTTMRNVVTVEDPVEYRLDGITQVQVKPDIGMSFASSLRSILRQDPDVILIGEIRDIETAEIAISAAQTGHLVLSTLHTNDATGAISRLVSLGVPAYQAASSLLGTVAQRLVRNICPKCAQTYDADPEEIAILLGSSDQQGNLKLHRGAGCNSCHETGYHGRTAVYEILEMTPRMRSKLIAGANDDHVKEQAIADGMNTLKTQGLARVLEGSTTIDELLRVVDVREI
jgi:type IV pilus assembly protein PilB